MASEAFEVDEHEQVEIDVRPKEHPGKAMRPPEPPSDEGGDGWLISYADMMTLIACFFILMTAFANYDPKTFTRKSKEVAEHFGAKKVEEEAEEMESLKQSIEADVELAKNTDIAFEDDGLKVTFSGSSLFKSGSAEMRPEIVETLDVMIELIQLKNPDYRVMIEGHSDSSPIPNSLGWRSNWELSSSRASRVVERFEKSGFTSGQLVAIGRGATQPVAPDYDDENKPIFENMALNRRVVIKVLKPTSEIVKKKTGLGAYFNQDELGGDMNSLRQQLPKGTDLGGGAVPGAELPAEVSPRLKTGPKLPKLELPSNLPDDPLIQPEP